MLKSRELVNKLIFKLKSKNKKEQGVQHKLLKYRATFITSDGKSHFLIFNWANRSILNCTVREYIISDVIDKGYMLGQDNIYYPLTNIVSIELDIVNTIWTLDRLDDWTVFYSDEEIGQMELYSS